MLVRHQQRNCLYLCIAGKTREYYRTERESYGVRRDIHFIGDIFRESLIPGKFAHFIRLFEQQVKANNGDIVIAIHQKSTSRYSLPTQLKKSLWNSPETNFRLISSI